MTIMKQKTKKNECYKTKTSLYFRPGLQSKFDKAVSI